MTSVQPSTERTMCSAASRHVGEDPAGSVPSWDACLLVEVPPPWSAEVMDSPAFPRDLREVLAEAEGAGVAPRVQALLPDPEYSAEGRLRLMYVTRPEGMFSHLDRADYLVPHDRARELLQALLLRREHVSRYEVYRQAGEGLRDLLVCTHGSRDACCGRFGYELYRHLRERHAGPGLRVWRTSHTGGHRFAPNVIDLPEGRYWARMDAEAVAELLRRDRPAAELARHYRGWAGVLTPFEQVAEREMLSLQGWEWVDFEKRSRVLSLEDDGRRAHVRVDFLSPAGDAGAYDAVVEEAGTVTVPSCLSGGPPGEAPVYRLLRFWRSA